VITSLPPRDHEPAFFMITKFLGDIRQKNCVIMSGGAWLARPACGG
jgi:hypothetical protein